MSWQTFSPPVNPDVQGKNKPELKLKKATFGDGYTQTTRDGLNHIRQVLDLVWSNLTLDEFDAIDSFLEDHGGDTPFFWTRPNRSSGPLKWTCEDWSDEDQENGLISISATFRQSFDPRNEP